MFLIHDSSGAIPVEQVDSEVEGLGKKLEGSVGLDEKIEQIGPHEPLDLGLNVD